MHTQCHSKLLEFEGHCSRRRRLVAKKLIFLFVFLRVPSCPFVDIFLSFADWEPTFPTLGEKSGLGIFHQLKPGSTSDPASPFWS